MARLLGIDPGTKRCGVAVSNTSESMAFPRPALATDESLLRQIRALVLEEEIEGIVVGRPVSLAGRKTSSTQVADELFEQLIAEFSPMDIVQVDERLTTVEASRSLSEAGLSLKQQKSHVDSAAAVILLQSFLEGRRVDG